MNDPELINSFMNLAPTETESPTQFSADFKAFVPQGDSKASILVSGFDDDTKEEELIAYFYRLVYGGGTRNINDGKVQSCHIISLPFSEEEKSSEGASKSLQGVMKVSLITFESKVLADLAL